MVLEEWRLPEVRSSVLSRAKYVYFTLNNNWNGTHDVSYRPRAFSLRPRRRVVLTLCTTRVIIISPFYWVMLD
jgi:hypothetical protein